MTESPVLYTAADGVAHLELNRPEAFNALNVELADALYEAVVKADGDDDVRVVLLSGRGKAFCAGGDVKAMAAAESPLDAVAELIAGSHRAVSALDALTKPVVAVVHGSVAGAGVGYVGASDLVLAGEGTKFISAFTAIGLSPDSGSSWYLTQQVGVRRAMELTLTNRALKAAEALDWGLVTSVHPDDEVLAAGRALAARLATGPAASYGRTRRLVRDAAATPFAEHLESEAAAMLLSAASPEAAAAIKAFAGK